MKGEKIDPQLDLSSRLWLRLAKWVDYFKKLRHEKRIRIAVDIVSRATSLVEIHEICLRIANSLLNNTIKCKELGIYSDQQTKDRMRQLFENANYYQMGIEKEFRCYERSMLATKVHLNDFKVLQKRKQAVMEGFDAQKERARMIPMVLRDA